MSLFLVMKRYDTSLAEYLAENNEGRIGWRTSLMILTQLLEGVAHLVACGIAHRDLKTDNLLLDLHAAGSDFPALVITDFGCCWADSGHGLKMPYHSHDANRGGNAALMAPEVVTATPGPFTKINYAKADAWAAGAIGYEVFGDPNPFYSTRDHRGLSNRTYKSKYLPMLSNEEVPTLVSELLRDLLRRDPGNRVSAELAATVCQLLLWAPGSWTKSSKSGGKKPNSQEILQWSLTITTKVLCESRFSNAGKALREYQLVATFLARLSVRKVKEALNWIHHYA